MEDLSKQLIMVKFKKWWQEWSNRRELVIFWTLLIRADLEWGLILISTMWADTWNLSQIGEEKTSRVKNRPVYCPTIEGTLIYAYDMVITWNDSLNMWMWWRSTVYDLIEGKYDNLSNIVCFFSTRKISLDCSWSCWLLRETIFFSSWKYISGSWRIQYQSVELATLW